MTSIQPQSDPARKSEISDLNETPWIIRLCPPAWHPYVYLMRLDRPIGTWLLLLPAFWAFMLAGAHAPHQEIKILWFAFLFSVGAIVMRSAGCVINDIRDKDIDAQVERTRTRPLVTGAISVRCAYLVLAGLLAIGFLILIQMNISVILLGILSLPFIVIYPFMKRLTWWPQFFLGLTFNFGALMGWAAVTGDLSTPPLYLYAAGVFWTLGYDTIYAHMDRADDEQIGVKSTARLLGSYTPVAVSIFYALSTILIGAALYSSVPTWRIFPALIMIGAGFAWQIIRLDIDNPPRCLQLFRFNRDMGLIILIAIALCVI